MAEEEKLSIPVEIPWKLASTTQKLKSSSEPDETTLSLFYYEPKLESLAQDYPDERLIYFKFAVSISSFWPGKGLFGLFARDLTKKLLQGGLPVWHALLDLRVMPDPFATGGIRPYFHAAAPLGREMVETGIVGNDLFEGESEGVSIGKSASQTHETVSSKIKGKSTSFGFSPPPSIGGLGFSTKSTKTMVDSERNVDQTIETTARDASMERRELLSHMTNVRNVLTLLNAKHVGSPYLRFSLLPRPLRLLSLDASDPNLWYSELLHRRSSGIEGIQEFVTVLVIPKGKNFCLEAQLRRFCVLDIQPKEPRINKYLEKYLPQDILDVYDYLDDIYPRGTPLEELDIDVISRIDEKKFPRPVVRGWDIQPNYSEPAAITESVMGVNVLYESPTPPPKYSAWPTADYDPIGVWFKDFSEVFLEMQRARYEEQLARSPLERGKVLLRKTELKTCFTIKEDGIDPRPADLHEGTTTMEFDGGSLPPIKDQSRAFDSSAMRYRQTMLAWNSLDRQLAAQIAGFRGDWEEPVRLDDPKIARIFMHIWSHLDSDDPRNLPLNEAAKLLNLNASQQKLLRTANVKDLRGIISAIEVAPRIEQHNAQIETLKEQLNERQHCLFDLKPIEFDISSETAAKLRETILKTFHRASEEG